MVAEVVTPTVIGADAPLTRLGRVQVTVTPLRLQLQPLPLAVRKVTLVASLTVAVTSIDAAGPWLLMLIV